MRPSSTKTRSAAHLPLDPLPGHSSRGRLERVLRRGEFAVTAELNPPDSADPEDVYERAAIFEGWVDGINAVDASGANCHMSSVGICALLTRMGYAPIMQIACRDRNRIAIQGDVLGAAAMGVANILCLTGDGVQAGDQPGAKPVFDLDCMSLLETVRIMRDNGKFLSGRKLTTPPQVFLGAAINPFAPPYDFRPLPARQEDRGRRAVRAEPVLLRRADVPRLTCSRCATSGCTRNASSWSASARSPRPRPPAGSAPTCRASIFPTPSSRGSKAPQNQKKEGKQLCIDIINEVKEIKGVSGVHVMAYRQEEYVAEIVHEFGRAEGPPALAARGAAATTAGRRAARAHAA